LAIEAYQQFEYRSNIANAGYADGYDAVVYGGLATLDPISRRAAQGIRLPALLSPQSASVQDPEGQFGLAVKQRADSVDWGVYGLRFTDKAPVLELRPPAYPVEYGGPAAGRYSLFYPGDIWLFGASLSGVVGGAQLGSEASIRHDMPLATAGIVQSPHAVIEPPERPIPRGDTVHAQISWNALTPPLPLVPDGIRWTGEIAANGLLSVTANPRRLMPGRTDFAATARTVVEFQFLQAIPHVDITAPIGIGYRFAGHSAVDPTMNAGSGDISIGATATVDGTWRGAIAFAHAIGRAPTTTDQLYAFDPARLATGDGNFVSVVVERKF
jgi:hypothetical protein